MGINLRYFSIHSNHTVLMGSKSVGVGVRFFFPVYCTDEDTQSVGVGYALSPQCTVVGPPKLCTIEVSGLLL